LILVPCLSGPGGLQVVGRTHKKGELLVERTGLGLSILLSSCFYIPLLTWIHTLLQPMVSLVFALALVTPLSVLGFDSLRNDNVRLFSSNGQLLTLTHVLHRSLCECAENPHPHGLVERWPENADTGVKTHSELPTRATRPSGRNVFPFIARQSVFIHGWILRLSHLFLQDDSIDVLPLAFLDVAFDIGELPSIDFANVRYYPYTRSLHR